MSNCFNAVQLFWKDTIAQGFLGPEEFVGYINTHFYQIELSTQQELGDVSIIWSRNSTALPIGKIRTAKLLKDNPGYPFGLIIEHAYTAINDQEVFQKRNPTPTGPYEVILENEAFAPYLKRPGFEITKHRRK